MILSICCYLGKETVRDGVVEWWSVLFQCLLAVIKVPSCLLAYHLILKQITANANNYVQIALTQVWI